MADEQTTSNEDSARIGQEQKVEESSRNLARRFSLLWMELYRFLSTLLSIREETDYEKTREGIVKDVSFRGHTVYILICSIFIASIGLNLNSPAVIIGAMLIAPLMGPILGIGLALGTNDDELLIKSLKNFGVMVSISLITSTVYFILTPLVEYQPELLARTKPTTLDIFVAIFGGVAGIVAGSRKEKSNVIPGVAIATALMPPLCTAGFGLATGNWPFFFGAFYLFLLNSVFICASTLIGVRYLRFPLRKFVNHQREKRVRFYMALFTTIVILPSLWIFWGVLKESWFKGHAESFVAEVVKMDGARIVNQNFVYNDSLSTIEVFVFGSQVPADTVKKWQSKLPLYGLETCQLEVFDGDNNDTEKELDLLSGKLQASIRADIVKDIYDRNESLLEDKERRIKALENELYRRAKSEIDIDLLSKELAITFSELKRIAYATSFEKDFETSRVDTIPSFLVRWDPKLSKKNRLKKEAQLNELMRVRLSLDTVRIIPFE
ncbi:MAG: TIGR00341 family protein [Cryomorphaceae bacterium]